jgi:hypothetical protein
VWLEFAGKVWEANVIPMVLILERTPPKPEDEIELWVPSAWPKEVPDPHEVARIAYRDFFDPKVNPRSSEDPLGYGEYLLPLLREGDPPILRKLYPGGENCVALTEAMETQYTRHRNPQPFWWTYGVTRAGVKVTEAPQGARPFPVLAGGGLAVAWAGEPVGYVDLEAVRSPSIWGREEKARTYLAVAEIARAPFGVLVRKEKPSVAVNTVIVGIPKPGLGEAVAAYLNSALVRWYYLVRLRSGVLEGSSRAHIYPRTLEALPWPREPREDLLGKLSALYGDLEALARESRDNPSEWFLREVEDRIDRGEALPLSAPLFGLDFRKWQDQVPRIDLSVEGAVLKGSLHAELDLKDPNLARFVHLLLGLLEAETVGSEDLQKLLVPRDYRDLLREYDNRERAFSGVRERFTATLEAVDEVVFDLFGLTPDERAHVKARLASFPLNRLRPRYPWEVGEPRPLRAYTEDRFR